MNNNTRPCNPSSAGPAASPCGWRHPWVLPVVAVLAFVGGNLAPPLRAVFTGLEPATPTKAESRNEKPGADTPNVLKARWTELRDKTDQDLRLAESILAVMRIEKAPALDVQAQEKKIQVLHDLLDVCDRRLRDLADEPLLTAPAQAGILNAVELDIKHRAWLDEVWLQKIIRESN